jgi:hypothetical protein
MLLLTRWLNSTSACCKTSTKSQIQHKNGKLNRTNKMAENNNSNNINNNGK